LIQIKSEPRAGCTVGGPGGGMYKPDWIMGTWCVWTLFLACAFLYVLAS